jgi:hypothetical protein
MVLTKKDTNVAKGMAISLMLAHHLYNFKDKLSDGNFYIPVLIGHDAEHQIGDFGKICVSMFLFLSGYGLYKSSLNKSSLIMYILTKLTNFYKVYWSYFLVFIPIGVMFFPNVKVFGSDQLRYTLNLSDMIKNFVGVASSFNSEWWFIKLYLFLLILFPLYKYIIDRNTIAFVCLCYFLYAVTIYVDSPVGLLLYQLGFATGMLIAKYDYRLDMSNIIHSFKFIYCSFGICTLVLLRVRFMDGSCDFIFAPVFAFLSIGLINCMKLSNIFEFLGKYSFPMWLNHSFFCYYYFQDIVFFPKYSPLIFITLLGFSLASAIVVENSRSWLGSHLEWTRMPKTR